MARAQRDQLGQRQDLDLARREPLDVRAKGICSDRDRRGCMGESTKNAPAKVITLSMIYDKLDTWVKQGKAKKEKDTYVVNLDKTSINRKPQQHFE